MPTALTVRIRHQYRGYEDSLLMCVLRAVSPVPVVTRFISTPHLEILGPFKRRRPLGSHIANNVQRLASRPAKLVLYHTEENTRYNAAPGDFAISSDLGVTHPNHFRMPNWWTSIDWQKHGIRHPPSPRIRNLIDIETLLRPLGENVLQRPRRAAFFTSHLREPRRTLLSALSSAIEIEGYGRAFDKHIKHHNKSGVFKEDVLASYMFSLCPENSMYPGYYTEKVPESFAAGCIPIAWADQSISTDFVPGSYINLADFASTGYCGGFSDQLRPEPLARLVSTPLLHKPPHFAGLLQFVEQIVDRALR